jgi:hypothetical protein
MEAWRYIVVLEKTSMLKDAGAVAVWPCSENATSQSNPAR